MRSPYLCLLGVNSSDTHAHTHARPRNDVLGARPRLLSFGREYKATGGYPSGLTEAEGDWTVDATERRTSCGSSAVAAPLSAALRWKQHRRDSTPFSVHTAVRKDLSGSLSSSAGLALV